MIKHNIYYVPIDIQLMVNKDRRVMYTRDATISRVSSYLNLDRGTAKLLIEDTINIFKVRI